MSRITVPLLAMEFEEGGNTVWFQGLAGTVFRIKANSPISVKPCDQGLRFAGSHGDLFVYSDIEICLGNDAGLELDPDKPLTQQLKEWTCSSGS